MTVAKITGPGLAAMAVSVGVLWGCFIGEQLLVRSAAREQTRVLRELQSLRQRYRDQPAFTPAPRMTPRHRRAAG